MSKDVRTSIFSPLGDISLPPPTSWSISSKVDFYGCYRVIDVFGVRAVMRWIQPGRFLMGSSESEAFFRQENEVQHEVKITNGFWLAETACTQQMWQAVMGENPSCFTGDPMRPVEQISWFDCQEFIRSINSIRSDGLVLRLPSEAEWEYACRAGTTTTFCFGDILTANQANFDSSLPDSRSLARSDAPLKDRLAKYLYDDDEFAHTATFTSSLNFGVSQKQGNRQAFRGLTLPVKHFDFKPNAWGLHQMHGNVWEWCSDFYGPYPNRATDPMGQEVGEFRVRRGGAWNGHRRSLRSAFRGFCLPDKRVATVGLRFACD